MFFIRIPDKPTPIGCLAGFFSLFFVAFAGMAFWGAHKAFSKQPPMLDTGKRLIMWGLIAVLPAIAGIGFCIYRLMTIGDRDNYRSGRSICS